MNQVTSIARYLLALMLLVFGLNKFFNFMSMPPMPEKAQAYMQGIASTGVIFPLLGVIYIATAVALVANKFAPLMLLVLSPVTVNILIFHASLDPTGIGPGLVLAVLNVLSLIHYRSAYRPLLKP